MAVQVYHFMGLANHLLRTACEESARRGATTQSTFEAWARAHAEEEAAHPAWLLKDLSAAGCQREHLLASQPDEELRELAQAQLTLIHDSHPTAVLGLYFATECHPPDAEALRRISRRFGIPMQAMRTLLHHSQVDPGHGRDIHELVATYGRDPAQLRAMAQGALQSLNSWIRMIQRYCAEAMAGQHARGGTPTLASERRT